jgi:DNA-binding NtrC family response regulator
MKKNVLIIEDEATTKLLYGEAFKNADFNLLMAGDGYSAKNILKQNPISLVVTDLLMPLVGGGAIISHLNLYHPEIPVIVVSAHLGDEEEVQDLTENVKATFPKPVDFRALRETIDALLAM